MHIVPRRVHLIPEKGSETTADTESRPLSDFRAYAAWVLLGEPGAGKTSAFEQEAAATGGLKISIVEFLIEGLRDDLRGKTLFLDGLDETRASGEGESILLRVHARLRLLGCPPFRIACRAADWFGATDADILKPASPDGELATLLLDPLSDEDVVEILRCNYQIDDPEGFVEQATRQGVADLLGNPQTLGLLANAICGDQWPQSREQTFALACEKLAEEPNKTHRNLQRANPRPRGALLDAAGHVCAILLLADKAGIALDRERADSQFPVLDDLAPPDPASAAAVVHRALFRASEAGVERMVPAHRSIAEYLAARWLARRIDEEGLPLGRVLNLLLGADGRTVAGLRGLYGWLALHCQVARAALIAADPLTVIVYGDVKPMSPTDKRALLAGLAKEAGRHAAFRWGAGNPAPFGALADPELLADFREILESPDRDNAAQSLVDAVLTVLAEGMTLPELTGTVKNIILDESHWNSVRSTALEVWLKAGTATPETLALLGAITDGSVADDDDELTGILLSHLYPGEITPERLINFLYRPKSAFLTGSYSFFWRHELLRKAPLADLPILLDGIAARTDLFTSDDHDYLLGNVLNSLLASAIALLGEQMGDERLFAWLGIRVDEDGYWNEEQGGRQLIGVWLEEHPDRYKALLSLCSMRCEAAENPRFCFNALESRLRGAKAPEDIGLWHLARASQTTNEALAETHLSEAVATLMRGQGDANLTLETLEDWGDAHPERKHLLAPLLTWEIPVWRSENAARKASRRERDAEAKRKRSSQLRKLADKVRSGTASAAAMHELAGVWLNHYTDVHGDTPTERFDSYSDYGAEALSAAESGFRLCPQRPDLPAVADIIDLSTQQKEHFIRRPCLVGMELRWRDGTQAVDTLDDDILRRMIAFRLTYGADNTPAWFLHLVKTRPELVAEVLVDYAGATLRSKSDFVDGIYALAHDPLYGAVARGAAPRLLDGFPLRCRSGQLNHLEYLLKAALRHVPEVLAEIVARKSVTRSMDAAQKVYWLATGMLLSPARYESALWDYIGKSQARANHLVGFLSERSGDFSPGVELSPRTTGKLIELLAPHAELEWSRGGFVTDTMRRGDYVRALVRRLGSMATPEAAAEVEHLITQPGLHKLKFQLEDTRHQLQIIQREKAFRFLNLADVAQILANREPTDARDLAALALAHLDDIARNIRTDSGDHFRLFWTETPGDNQPKPENSCRDALRSLIRPLLVPFGIDCQPEVDHFNGKRADILLSYRNEIELPIEIKGEWNEALWTGLRKQLIDQYAIAPKAANHGVYVVLWVGVGRQKEKPLDGGKRPRSAAELQSRLEALLNPVERRSIFIRVLDVSWPPKS